MRLTDDQRQSFQDGFKFASSYGERKSLGGSSQRQTTAYNRRGPDQVSHFCSDVLSPCSFWEIILTGAERKL